MFTRNPGEVQVNLVSLHLLCQLHEDQGDRKLGGQELVQKVGVGQVVCQPCHHNTTGPSPPLSFWTKDLGDGTTVSEDAPLSEPWFKSISRSGTMADKLPSKSHTPPQVGGASGRQSKCASVTGTLNMSWSQSEYWFNSSDRP